MKSFEEELNEENFDFNPIKGKKVNTDLKILQLQEITCSLEWRRGV